MPEFKVDNAGELGIITDVPAHTLPPNAWTSGRNVRFVDGKVEKFKGSISIYEGAEHPASFLHFARIGEALYWVYAGDEKVSTYFNDIHRDISREEGGPYAASKSNIWTGGSLGGLLILNNYGDIPQYWATPTSRVDSTTTTVEAKLRNLPGWPEGYRCKAMVPYKQHIFALNMRQGPNDIFPHRVLWSDLTDVGNVPTGWDITDPTRDAGQNELDSEGSSGLVNGLELDNRLILYENNSIWEVTPSNNVFIFNFEKLYRNVGLGAAHAVAEIPQRRQHFLYTGEDIVIHDGPQMESILKKKERRLLINSINENRASSSYVFVNRINQEMWFCYPSSGSEYPNEAIVYNYETQLISHRNMKEFSFIASGSINSPPTFPWDSIRETWVQSTKRWTEPGQVPEIGFLAAETPSSRFYALDKTNLESGSVMLSNIERRGISIAGSSQDGVAVGSLVTRKLISRIWPKITGGPVTVRVLMQEFLDGPITYSPKMIFDPAVNRPLDLPRPMSGLLWGVRFESDADVAWQLHGYTVELEALGDF